jgi:hypothetical protein
MIRCTGTWLLLSTGIALNTVACSGIGAKYSPPLATVTVDFATQKGPATQRASGFLHSVTPTAPGGEMLDPVKPRLFRLNAKQVSNGELFRRLVGYGADVQAIMSDAHGYSKSQAWPGDGGDWTAWENLVERLVLDAKAKGNRVLWDVWNEPDDETFWKRNQQQFFETWRRAVVRIRRLDPDAVIVGPSTGLGDYLREFLLYAKEKDVLPDVVSWHELWPGNLEQNHAASVRMFMSLNGIPERSVSINEFQQADGRHKPGVVVAWLTHVEEEKPESAAYACWDDPLGYSDCWEPTLDGLLTIDKETRAGWFAHEGYADITGTLVQVDSQAHSIGPKIAGVAGMDADRRLAQLLLGRREVSDATGSGGVTVVFQNISEVPYLMKNGMVLVRAERIPDSGLADLSRTKVTINRSYPVLDNTVRVELPDFDAWDAYIVRLKEPVTEASSSP